MNIKEQILNEITNLFSKDNETFGELIPFTEKTFQDEVEQFKQNLYEFLEEEPLVQNLEKAAIKRQQYFQERKQMMYGYRLLYNGWKTDGTHTIGYYYLGNDNGDTMNVFIVNGQIYEAFMKDKVSKMAVLYRVTIEKFNVERVVEFFANKIPGELEVNNTESKEFLTLYNW
ncbi:hypothetical protein CON36_31400 [Bacillus cereus]|uniref:Uncharacterized protein n=2 Tax=Bacillus cereus group TaxID=86661 RepID=A0A9X6ZUY0_BACTU|nr:MULTISPECIES: hypothetical protein [Bacillus cereus group]PDZ94892.1 hypothetical protein CON36_31400 [Bacillus cereus]PFJ42710.1 hypothetical protein COJ15_05050 [Bacillus thuringiensis]PGP21024.1 hypothetical protein COA01_15915 [Bacillus cereus]